MLCRILGSHTGGYDELHLAGYIAMHSAECLPPLATCFMLVSCLAYSLTLKMEAAYSSENSVDFQRTTRRYFPEHKIPLAYLKIGKMNSNLLKVSDIKILTRTA
jgi:hypothetical protein